MRIELENGRDIDVRRPGWFAFRQRGLLNSVRGEACDQPWPVERCWATQDEQRQ